jgi:OmpA-OmpF porin, OOP family
MPMCRFLFSLLLCLSLPFLAQAQSGSYSTRNVKAIGYYDKALQYIKGRDFDKALFNLENAVKRDPKFGEAYVKAASLNRTLGNQSVALENYRQGFSILKFNASFSSEYYIYAELSMKVGEYEEAEKFFDAYLKTSPKNQRLAQNAQHQIKNCQFAVQARKHPVEEFKPVQMDGQINQFVLQYFPTVTADQRFFLYTARKGEGLQHDENIYISQSRNGNWLAPVSISPNINTSANEGAATISGDGKTLVFSSCNRPDSHGDCDLYISRRTGNDWSPPQNMGRGVNSPYWDSQPTLSADGRTLYFSSSRPSGSLGMEDIWVTVLQENNIWSAPRNVGEPINTAGRDLAPFLHSSGTTLYFASDGHVGMGGLDIFKTSLTRNTWSSPENLGYPLNTHEHEGSFSVTSNNTKGYYSRQVHGEDGRKNIFLFEFGVPEAWRSKDRSTYAQGRVLSSKTKQPLMGEVQLYDLATGELAQQVSSDQVSGEYTIVLTEGSAYGMYVSAPGHLLHSFNFDYSQKKEFDPQTLDIYLDPVSKGASIVLNNLFFDTGKYQLEAQSKTELQKLVDFMKQYSELRIEISGHTDDIGTDKANLDLSEKRAQSVVEYLTRNGVPKERLSAIGYGKVKPVKPNTSEENRQLNRRIELKIL